MLAINWPGVGLQAAYLLVSLSLLVLIHEFGHFITAKWFKCRVEKFYIFFDPWFSLFKKKVKDTEYGIGWLPLGGYVKIAGMIDESMDKEQMKQPPQPWEFRSKPAWQRLIIMLAGVTMNVLLAFVIYAMVLYKWGETRLPMNNVKDGIWVTDSLMNKIGLENGDKILAVNGETVPYFNSLQAKILMGQNIEIERNGVKKEIQIPVNLIGQLVDQRKKGGSLLVPRIPVVIGQFTAEGEKNAEQYGLRPFDQIVAVDSTPVAFFDQMIPVLDTLKDRTVKLTVVRDGQRLTKEAKVDSAGKIGFYVINEAQADSLGILRTEFKKYSLAEAFPAGVKKTGQQLKFYIDQFKMIFNPKTEAYKGLGGFKAMASIFPDTGWSWPAFWQITAFFSIILAFMNLLPIPALDGGHVLFTLVEMVTGRKPSDKFLEYAQIVGMVILLGLLLYANLNDWFGYGK